MNGASFAAGEPVAPGGFIAIFGSNLADRIAGASTVPLSTTLGGVTVKFVNGGTNIDAPLVYVQSNQINAQVPWEIVPQGTTQNVNMIVSRDGLSSSPTPVTVGPFSPAIFATTTHQAIVVNTADGSVAQPPGSIPGLITKPVKPGDVVYFYATGLGAVNKPVRDGYNSADQERDTLTKPIVLVGGVSAEVLFSGLSPQYVALNQVNIKIPNVAPGNAVPIQIQIGGLSSQGNLTIAVSQ